MAEISNDMLLLAYVEGEASERDRARVEALIEQDPRLGYLLARLIADRRSLQQIPDPPAPDWLMEEIDRQLERDMLVVGTFVDAEQTVLRQRRLVSRLVMGGALAAMIAVVATVLVSSLTNLQPPVTVAIDPSPPSPGPETPENRTAETSKTAPSVVPGAAELAAAQKPDPEGLAAAGGVGPAHGPTVPLGGEPAPVTPDGGVPAIGVADAAVEAHGGTGSPNPTVPPATVAGSVPDPGKSDHGDDRRGGTDTKEPGVPEVFGSVHPGIAPGLLPVPKPPAAATADEATMRLVEEALEIPRLLGRGGTAQVWILVSRDRDRSGEAIRRLADAGELKSSATAPGVEDKPVHRLSGPGDRLAGLLMRVRSDPATTKLFQLQPPPVKPTGKQRTRSTVSEDKPPVRAWPKWTPDFASILREQVKTDRPATDKTVELELRVVAATDR